MFCPNCQVTHQNMLTLFWAFVHIHVAFPNAGKEEKMTKINGVI